MDYVKLLIVAVIAIAGLTMFTLGMRKDVFKKKGFAKTFSIIVGVVFLAYGVVGVIGQLGVPLGGADTFFLSGAVVSPGATGGEDQSSGDGDVVTFQPTGTYTTKDKYSTTTVSGTSYYKRGSNSATTTAQTNLNKGEKVSYWVDNATYWVKPDIRTAGKGVTTFEADAWSNSTATITLYDTVNRQATTNGAYNTSLGANADASIEITYDGTAKGSAGPFGGVMVFEYNSTISSVICTGDVLLNTNPYHVTYTVSSTDKVSKQWAYSSSMDDGTGAPHKINCEVKNGATAVGAGSSYIANFIPANYYVTNSGNIVLDTEKNADGDNTRTGSVYNQPTATGYFGA